MNWALIKAQEGIDELKRKYFKATDHTELVIANLLGDSVRIAEE